MKKLDMNFGSKGNISESDLEDDEKLGFNPTNDLESDDKELIREVKLRKCENCNQECELLNNNVPGYEMHLKVNHIVKLFQQKRKKFIKIFNLPIDVLEVIFSYLDNEDKLNFILSSRMLVEIFGGSSSLLRSFVLIISVPHLKQLSEAPDLFYHLPFTNFELDFDSFDDKNDVLVIFKKFKSTAEILKLKNAKFNTYQNFFDLIVGLEELKTLSLENCKIKNSQHQTLSTLFNLHTISIKNCNENIFKVFELQNNLTKITIQSDKIVLSNEIFHKMANKFKKLEHLVLLGDGTQSFFDSQIYAFKLKKFETSMLTCHWYVNIKTERISFLKSQLGHLKELTIHQLPNDFDGGRVMHFILNYMNLETFYYGKIPLILNGLKQEVKKLEATEIQICSAYEMVEQFSSITSFKLNLHPTEMSTQDVEIIVNQLTNSFNNIEEFEIVDNSGPRFLMGVFLGLLCNLRNLKKLTLRTQDRNISVLLEEFLPYMKKLNEIYITCMDNKWVERLNLLKIQVRSLKKLSVPEEIVEKAKQIFGERVEIYEI